VKSCIHIKIMRCSYEGEPPLTVCIKCLLAILGELADKAFEQKKIEGNTCIYLWVVVNALIKTISTLILIHHADRMSKKDINEYKNMKNIANHNLSLIELAQKEGGKQTWVE